MLETALQISRGILQSAGDCYSQHFGTLQSSPDLSRAPQSSPELSRGEKRREGELTPRVCQTRRSENSIVAGRTGENSIVAGRGVEKKRGGGRGWGGAIFKRFREFEELWGALESSGELWRGLGSSGERNPKNPRNPKDSRISVLYPSCSKK